MLIHIRRNDNKVYWIQEAEIEDIMGVVTSVSTVYFTGRKQMFRRLCGSI